MIFFFFKPEDIEIEYILKTCFSYSLHCMRTEKFGKTFQCSCVFPSAQSFVSPHYGFVFSLVTKKLIV